MEFYILCQYGIYTRVLQGNVLENATFVICLRSNFSPLQRSVLLHATYMYVHQYTYDI